MAASSRPWYVALGDALSIDDYAGGPGRGAASLLYRDDGRFPGFAGRDLRARVPRLGFQSLARERAPAAVVALEQVPALEEMAGRLVVVSLTAGRDDWLGIWGAESQTGEVAARELGIALDEILGETRRIAGEEAAILVANLPDPTDRTGDFETLVGEPWDDGLVVLDLLNRAIEEAVDAHEATLVDLHGALLGHGMAALDPDHPHHDPEDPSVWYVESVELNERGASALRRLLLDRLEDLLDR